jgi:hypothetical protein
VPITAVASKEETMSRNNAGVEGEGSQGSGASSSKKRIIKKIVRKKKSSS